MDFHSETLYSVADAGSSVVYNYIAKIKSNKSHACQHCIIPWFPQTN